VTSGHQRRAQKDYWQLSREFEHYLKSSYRLQENLNLPSVLLGKFEQKPGWECISSFAIHEQYHQQNKFGID